ncbi:hypothetical protein ACJD0Z_04690 [Flavobacteriaceae bacterium M23B6Z8]
MKKATMNPEISKILQMATFLFILIGMMSCSNDSISADEQNNEPVTFQLLDVTVVNTSNGIPRKTEDLELLPETLQMYQNETNVLLKGECNMESLTWEIDRNNSILLNLKTLKTDTVFISKDNDTFELVQNYNKTGKFSGGSVNYTYVKVNLRD